MAEVAKIDIDGVQWDIKDQNARDRIAELEEKTTKNFEYSTVEQKIGKWIDGKDIYRLTLIGETKNRTVFIDLSDKNIENVTKLNGVCLADDTYFFPIPYYKANTVDELRDSNAYTNYGKINKILFMEFGKASYFNNVKFNFEIEYTKNN